MSLLKNRVKMNMQVCKIGPLAMPPFKRTVFRFRCANPFARAPFRMTQRSQAMGGKWGELTWHLMDGDFPRSSEYNGVCGMRFTRVHAG
jgi:hypothetical protein